MYKPKKKYGQNFLVDKNILNKIVAAAQLQPDDVVLEIGMGQGILTEALAQKCAKLITIEIDQDIFPQTKNKLEKYENVDFILGDFLKKADSIFKEIPNKIKIVANIPYYITTPILEKLLEHAGRIDFIVIMMQKEVADRIRAKPESKAYGSLTLFINFYCEVEKICDVSPNSFRPSPTVQSTVLRLVPRQEKKYFVESPEKLFNIIRAAFWGRRKMLASVLRKAPQTAYSKETIENMARISGLDLKRRGETLTLEEFIKLASVREQ